MNTQQFRRWLGAAGVSIFSLAGATVATAAITPSRDALAVAKAIAQTPSVVTSADFVAIPPNGSPVALADSPFGEFPRSGGNFAILSSGDATLTQQANISDSTSTDLGGPVIRGARDVTTLRIGLNVPANSTCLSIRFRFYSDEYPEFVGSQFNDAFIAELDSSTWDAAGPTSPTITAPNNFVKDELGRNISINGAGVASVSAGLASTTTYDAATAVLRGSVPITPGAHSLFLTIFDQSDSIYDSSVFLDRLSLDKQTPCVAGVAADLTPGPPPEAILLANDRVSVPAARLFAPRRLAFEAVKYTRTRGGAVKLKATVRDNFGFRVRRAYFTAISVPPGLVSRTATASDVAGEATVTLKPTRRLRQIGKSVVYTYLCARKQREREGRGISNCQLSKFVFRP